MIILTGEIAIIIIKTKSMYLTPYFNKSELGYFLLIILKDLVFSKVSKIKKIFKGTDIINVEI